MNESGSSGAADRALQALREGIDALDDQILALLHERAACAREIAAIKHDLGLPRVDEDREREILERISAMSAAPMDADRIREIWRAILGASRD